MPGQEQPKKLEVTKCAMLQRPWEDVGQACSGPSLHPPSLAPRAWGTLPLWSDWYFCGDRVSLMEKIQILQ